MVRFKKKKPERDDGFSATQGNRTVIQLGDMLLSLFILINAGKRCLQTGQPQELEGHNYVGSKQHKNNTVTGIKRSK